MCTNKVTRRLFRGIGNFSIVVENRSNRWSEEFKPNPDLREMGWKAIGEFDLVAGNTDVVIVSTTQPSVVLLPDAIRWSRIVTEN